MNESNAITKALVDELGGETYLQGGNGALAGRLEGIRFAEKPDGWKLVHRYMAHNMYYPKALKQNKNILVRICKIPVVKRSELNELVGFKSQVVGMTFIQSVGVVWGTDYHLITVHDEVEFTIIDGMVEITTSEFKRLKEVIEEARKEVVA